MKKHAANDEANAPPPPESAVELEARFQWMFVRICGTFPSLREKAFQLCTDVVLRRPMQQFLEDRESSKLFVHYVAKDSVFKSDNAFPFSTSKDEKLICFIKLNHPVPTTNIGSYLMSMECKGFLPEFLEKTTIQVFSTLIDSPAFSDLGSTKDVLYKMHTIMSQLHVLVGRTRGKTLLPLPPDHLTAELDASQKNVTQTAKAAQTLATIESIVITWMSQIKEVTVRDSESGANSCEIAMPESELYFWEKQSADLGDLYDQLISSGVAKKVVGVLKSCRSMYTVPFHQLCRDLTATCEIANDVYLHIKPLEPLFDQLAHEKIADAPRVLKNILFHVFLMWRESDGLRYPTRIVVLVRKICNRIIKLGQAYVPNQILFSQIPEEGVERLTTCSAVIEGFKNLFGEYQMKILEVERAHAAEDGENSDGENVDGNFDENGHPRPSKVEWGLHPIIFQRLDKFANRCADVKEIMQNMVEFTFLDKIEVGGSRGSALSLVVTQAVNDFSTIVTKLRDATFELTDLSSPLFDSLFVQFKSVTDEIERKVAAVAVQMMEDSTSIMGQFSVLDGFHLLLNRECVKTELEIQKHLMLVKFNAELGMAAAKLKQGMTPGNKNLNAFEKDTILEASSRSSSPSSLPASVTRTPSSSGPVLSFDDELPVIPPPIPEIEEIASEGARMISSEILSRITDATISAVLKTSTPTPPASTHTSEAAMTVAELMDPRDSGKLFIEVSPRPPMVILALDSPGSDHARSDASKSIASPVGDMGVNSSQNGSMINLLTFDFDDEFASAAPPISDNMPPRAGAVAWCRSILETIKKPLERMRRTKGMLDSDEGREVLTMSESILIQARRFEETQVAIFNSEAEIISQENLKQNILTYDAETDTVRVNFNDALLRVLREVKYFLQLGVEVSPHALELYKKVDIFRQYTSSLDSTVKILNEMKSTMKDIERPLIAAKLDGIDKVLKKGIKHLNWKSQAIPDFIKQSGLMIKETAAVHNSMKSNVLAIGKILKTWANVQMIVVPKQTLSLHAFLELQREHIAQRHDAIVSGAESVHTYLHSTAKVLKGGVDSAEWHAYTDFVSQIVIDGLVDAVVSNLECLCENMCDTCIKDSVEAETGIETHKSTHAAHQHTHESEFGHARSDHSARPIADSLISMHHPPLIIITLELEGMDLIFKPDISPNAPDGVFEAILEMCRGVINIGMHVPRLAENYGDYLHDISHDIDVHHAMSRVMSLLAQGRTHALKFLEDFSSLSYLWTQNIREEYEKFILEKSVDGVVPLEIYDEIILHCRSVEDQAQKLSDFQILDGWLQVDASPAKHAICMQASKWTFTYKDALASKIASEASSLSSFVSEAALILEKNIAGDDVPGLIELLRCMREVKIRTDFVLDLQGPMLDTISLLKKHGHMTDPSTISVFTDSPTNWADLQKKMTGSKEKYGAFTTEERSKLFAESKKVEQAIRDFIENFRENIPATYSHEIEKAYAMIDSYHHSRPQGCLVSLLQDAERVNELQELFEVQSSDFSDLRQCLADVKLLKTLWDSILFVKETYTQWRETKWQVIDVDELVENNRQILKNIRLLPGAMKKWAGFSGLENVVKNMGTSLPLVQELHDPAMRQRHWTQLSESTNVRVQVDDKFTLGNMLDLELHNHVETVTEIVDRAQKELVIEKQLAKIKNVWETQQLEFYYQDEIPMLTSPEGCVEALEENFMTLQSLQSSKYVQDYAVFAAEVAMWQEKLATVDSILTAWMEVQKMWVKLHSIFVGSADIRIQLPDDAKRFAQADDSFKELMNEASYTTNALVCCTFNGRLERVEIILTQLEQCEKALVDYLETKRIIYPRFYFVSGADLLDILSKGSNPQAISSHISKCFDNIKSLQYEREEGGALTKKAIGMTSGEGECVWFEISFLCDGAVEIWLKDLTAHTHQIIRNILGKAVAEFEPNGRNQFMFSQPAQVAVVVLRIDFTAAVDRGFELIESGTQGDALRKYNLEQTYQLNSLAALVLTDLTSNQRRVLITVITVEVHARDVVGNLIGEKADSKNCFSWTAQLRYFVEDEYKSAKFEMRICDYTTEYGYEYIGNCGCLVITPLTDRCYITLTQAMRLCLGGAPSGPAGTGKTETTKDLGRSLGVLVYVFNCSDQMDYKSMGQIFKGLAQAGAWGCFDEFNRIDVSVLSVVSTQFKSVLDAIRAGVDHFVFEEDEISLCRLPLCCAFITMNPGYAGRTELPESVKALFRPCAMIVPDMDLISEIMLMSEGFSEGKLLAKKFMILYRLNESLLSPQKHYDWKLRAIKTTLNVAGGMRRADPNLTEDKVLLRALRDFNLGKLVADDVNIFMGLLNDLFPNTLDLVPRKRNLDFEELIGKAAAELNLQPDEIFTLKISQLRELLGVRWSVFVLGPAGCGKSSVIKTLAKSQIMHGEKTTMHILNPKAVTRNELYGYIHPSTREWKDGLISQIFRDLSNIQNIPHEYICLDGDIDPEWIESMNTVMDDNKTLTLASNERIPLTPPMRLIFEIENLREASPATVSRAGIIYMNDSDVGWFSLVKSWVHWLELRDQHVADALLALFREYIPPAIQFLTKNLKLVIPLPLNSIILSVCSILETLMEHAAGVLGGHSGLLNRAVFSGRSDEDSRPASANKNLASKSKDIGKEDVPESTATILDSLFSFSCIWGVGGCVGGDKLLDYTRIFDKFWKELVGAKIPVQTESVFGFRVDLHTGNSIPWASEVPKYEHDPELPFSSIFVHSAESQRIFYLHKMLSERHKKIMFVGGAGTGKSAMMRSGLREMNTETYSWLAINLNCMTTSLALQNTMESALEKKTGRTYGPPGKRLLTFFIDDINMPQVDLYGTQQPIALLRQLCDYMSWYDRAKLTLKDIRNVSLVACMNPLAGSFTIDPRMQRHFVTISIQMPQPDVLASVFKSILEGHLNAYPFKEECKLMCTQIVKASLDAHKNITENFLPTGVKFHYNFNLRELSSLFEGLCRVQPAHVNSAVTLARLWLHESERVYCDRLMTPEDVRRFHLIVSDTAKNFFVAIDTGELLARPLMFSSVLFSADDASGGLPYGPCDDLNILKNTLDAKLEERNETNAIMRLVLFEQAVEHVCRISRAISNPGGHSLLVGVGGSGKQSLAKLAAYICGYEVFQITVTSTYGLPQFKEDLFNMYARAGSKSVGICFILTDSQVVDDSFLVLINDLLSTGSVSELMSLEQKEELCGSVRSEMKQMGIIADSPEQTWNYFVEKTKKYLHTVLCFSPVGEGLRVRARQFPAITACTCIDWFHAWSREALEAVGGSFLTTIPGLTEEVRLSVTIHLAFAHESVGSAGADFKSSEGRFNYTTPKSFLDFVDFYCGFLSAKRSELKMMMDRLENGLGRIQSASDQVQQLQESLAVEIVNVEDKKKKTEELLVQVARETAITEEQNIIAKNEEENCAVLAAEATQIQDECKKDLEEAEPLLVQAVAALASLDKKSLVEMKALTTPPQEVADVMAAILILTARAGNIPKDYGWQTCKKLLLASPDKMLQQLQEFDKDNVPDANVTMVEKIFTSKSNFNPVSMKSKSVAAAGLCAWVVNICKYVRLFQMIEPKRQSLEEAKGRLTDAKDTLNSLRAKVTFLESKLAELTSQFEVATDEKNGAIQQMERTLSRANLAERLVSGLSDEKIRWAESLKKLQQQESNLIGDCLIASAFVSYVGSFTSRFRNQLVFDTWLPDLLQRGIQTSDGITPLSILTNESDIATWRNDGLPADSVSTQNGAIVSNCKRWPLLIDPQLQGISWIRNKHKSKAPPQVAAPMISDDGETPTGKSVSRSGPSLSSEFSVQLIVLQLGQPKYLNRIEAAISVGDIVLIENLGETIEAVLEPVLTRSVFKRGKSLLVKIGDKEVEYDPNFRLYLQTKLSNPHYNPEVSAQTTIVNFMITHEGFEEQLLALVVNKERPELEEKKQELMRKENLFRIKLKELEDDILYRLSSAEGDILSNVDLIQGLEKAKVTALEINEQSRVAAKTSTEISLAREFFRMVASCGSMAYFVVDALANLDHMYRFSMSTFVEILQRGMDEAEKLAPISSLSPTAGGRGGEEEEEGGNLLMSKAVRGSITTLLRETDAANSNGSPEPIGDSGQDPRLRIYQLVEASIFRVFTFVAQGLFEKHKIVFVAQLVLGFLQLKGSLDRACLDFLVRSPTESSADNPCSSWLPDANWASVLAIQSVSETFENLPSDLAEQSKRFREWFELDRPEEFPPPGNWKNLSGLAHLCFVRCLRPDRVPEAMSLFVSGQLGKKYITFHATRLKRAYGDSAAFVPVLFILCPGADPVSEVEDLGRSLGMTAEKSRYTLVSLGQGQEVTAERALENGARVGGFVFLQNIHLTPHWTKTFLDKRVDKLASAHDDFRLFLSAEPSKGVTIGILQSAIKLTNEPPQGLKANLISALGFVADPDPSDEDATSSKVHRHRTIVFALCFFHSVMLQRKKFGTQGFNNSYPFSTGDLSSCVNVAANYSERDKVPWEDIRYIFGEIMYGGHITDDWDRRLCATYLREYLHEHLLSETFQIAPNFAVPSDLGDGVFDFVDIKFPAETPVLFGMHPNSEIGFRLTQTDLLFQDMLALQPKSGAKELVGSSTEIVQEVVQDLLERLPEPFNELELLEKIEKVEKTPTTSIFLQETERMKFLLAEMRRSLTELDLGLKGSLQMSEAMDTLSHNIYMNVLPPSWAKLAYPSLRSLSSWFLDLCDRHKQLTEWTIDIIVPKSTWLGGLFNPNSFLTAIMQTAARKNQWSLDETQISIEVTRKSVEDCVATSKDGSFVHGLYLEGARWDPKGNSLDEPIGGELFSKMPVVNIKGVPRGEPESKDVYICPVFRTPRRGPTYVFNAILPSRSPASKWILGGVAILMDCQLK